MNLNSKVEVTTLGNLADKTMFLTLEFSRFGNSRQADVEVANTTADQKRFRHTKKLLESVELKAIEKADNALRHWLDAQLTVTRYGKSTRIVGYEGIKAVFAACRTYQKLTRPALVQKFVDVYLQRVAESQAALGDQFDASQFPTVQQVEQEFAFDFQLLSFSTPESLKSYAPEIFEMEKEKKEQMFSLAVDDWKQGRRAILQGMVNHILDILTPEEGKKKRLQGKTITKLQEFLNTYDLNSVPDDSDLQSDVAKLKLLMAGVDIDKIKESDNLKVSLVEGLKQASGSIATLVTNTGRKFR